MMQFVINVNDVLILYEKNTVVCATTKKKMSLYVEN